MSGTGPAKIITWIARESMIDKTTNLNIRAISTLPANKVEGKGQFFSSKLRNDSEFIALHTFSAPCVKVTLGVKGSNSNCHAKIPFTTNLSHL